MEWLRQAVGLNQEKQKMYTHIPVCSDGFVLNLISVLLIFCKPFTSKFNDYHQQFSKINCFYLYNDKYIINASKIEKLDNDALAIFKANTEEVNFTQITMQPTIKSSLMHDSNDMGSEDWEMPPVNFVTELFFMSHVLISLVTKKIEQQYEHLVKMINEAA